MTTINYYIRANKALVIVGGAMAAAFFIALKENRTLRKELEKRIAHDEVNIQCLFGRVRKLEEIKGDH